jgi:hypothetical protein
MRSWEGMAERRRISFYGLALTASHDSRKPPQPRSGSGLTSINPRCRFSTGGYDPLLAPSGVR